MGEVDLKAVTESLKMLANYMGNQVECLKQVDKDFARRMGGMRDQILIMARRLEKRVEGTLA